MRPQFSGITRSIHTVAAAALTPCIVISLAVMVLVIQEEVVPLFHKEILQLPKLIQCREMMWNWNVFFLTTSACNRIIISVSLWKYNCHHQLPRQSQEKRFQAHAAILVFGNDTTIQVVDWFPRYIQVEKCEHGESSQYDKAWMKHTNCQHWFIVFVMNILQSTHATCSYYRNQRRHDLTWCGRMTLMT